MSRTSIPPPSGSIAWSPSGELVAYTADTGPVVQAPATEPVRLDVGERVFSHVVGFQSEDDLLVVARADGLHHLLRCTPTGDCEAIEELGDSDALASWVFPRP